MEKTSFYEEISRNKRNSYILISFFFTLVILLSYIVGVVFFRNSVLGVAIGVFLGIIFTLIGYYSGDSLIAQVSHAKEAKKKEHPYLMNTVEGLSIAAGMPMPKVYIIDDSAINAFATGRSPEHAIVGVTSGALEKLNRTELEGVLAHEMSHIRNYDIRFMMLVTVLIGLVTLLSDFFIRSFFWGSRDRDNKQSNVVFLVVGLVLAILTPIIAQLVKFAISRRREYLADASGAQLTRYPKGLADALKKIQKDHEPLVEAANKATAHLWISNPLRGSKQFFDGMFSTHPPLDDRVKRLEAM
ncbi:M48 family metallopeptidase [Candidatus Woesearchaeota archaeon]|nr:M48 family metallopeptidase [Candidatus Woesearchaeota archaeon]